MGMVPSFVLAVIVWCIGPKGVEVLTRRSRSRRRSWRTASDVLPGCKSWGLNCVSNADRARPLTKGRVGCIFDTLAHLDGLDMGAAAPASLEQNWELTSLKLNYVSQMQGGSCFGAMGCWVQCEWDMWCHVWCGAWWHYAKHVFDSLHRLLTNREITKQFFVPYIFYRIVFASACCGGFWLMTSDILIRAVCFYTCCIFRLLMISLMILGFEPVFLCMQHLFLFCIL